MSLYQDPVGSEMEEMRQQMDNFPDQQTGSQPSVGNIYPEKGANDGEIEIQNDDQLLSDQDKQADNEPI